MSQRVRQKEEHPSAHVSDEYDYMTGSTIVRAPTERPPPTTAETEERRQGMIDAISVERTALSFGLSVSGMDMAEAGFQVPRSEMFDLGAIINSDLAYTGGPVPEDILQFVGGRLPLINIRISEDARIAAHQREAIEKIKLVIQYFGQIYDISPLELTEADGSVTLQNNWYTNFSNGQREQMSAMLLAAQSLDFDSMAAFFYVYDFLKTTVNQTCLAMASNFSGQGGVSDALSAFFEASENTQNRLMACLRGIVDNSANRAALVESAYSSFSAAQDAYHGAVRGISRYMAGMGESAVDVDSLRADVAREFQPTPSGTLPPELSPSTHPMEFQDIERSLFDSVMERYSQLRDTLAGMEEGQRLAIAAAMVGMPPGSRFEGRELPALDPNISNILGEYLSLAGVLSLFEAKARFNSILKDYIEYQKANEYRRMQGSPPNDTILLEMATYGGLPSSIDSEAVKRFIANREQYYAELPSLGGRLQAYGEFIRHTLVKELQARGLQTLYSTQQLEDTFLPIEGGVPALQPPDEHIAQPDENAMLFGPLSEYLSGLASSFDNVEEAVEQFASQQYDWNLQERFRNGDFWDKAYSFSKYFMKYGAADFIFWASVATLGIGTVARGVTLGLDLALGVAERGAVRSALAELASTSYAQTLAIAYRQATTATAIIGTPVWINAMRYFAGERSDEVYEDLKIAGLFLLMRRGAGFVPESLGSRVFAASAAGLGTTAAGARVYEDIQRGSTWEAVFDSVVFATGGALFVKSVSGIMRFRDAASAASGTLSAATAAGLGEVSFGAVGETVLNWASVGYAPHGFLSFYGMHAGFQALRNMWLTIPIASSIYAEGGIDALREYISSSYASAGNALPVMSIVLSGTMEGIGLVLGRGSARQTIEVSQLVPAQDPLLTRTAARIGASETAEQIARRSIYLDPQAAMSLRRYALTAPAQRQSEEALLAELHLTHPADIEAARGAMQEINRELAVVWDDVGILTSTTPVSEARAIQLVTRLEKTEQLRDLFAAGRTAAVGAIVVGAVAYSINDRLPAAREINEAQGRVLDVLNSLDSGSLFFMDALAAGAYPDMWRRSFRPDVISNFSITMAELLREVNGGSSPDGTSWSFFKDSFPDEADRIKIIAAVFLSLASHGRLDNPLAIGDYRTPLFNFASRLKELRDAGMDLSGMGVSDFFFLEEYYAGSDSTDKVENAYKLLRVLEELTPDSLEVDFNPVDNPQASRVISAAASYALANDKGLDWVMWACVQILSCCRPDQIQYWSAEMIYTMFSNDLFATTVSMPDDPAERAQAIVNLWFSMGQSDLRFPWNVYYPGEVEEYLGEGQ
ncbi:MAG: hypothetical protein PHY95_00670 [Candidatus ainarchaeum sp.]|nr:hypothetical protein [Candidatus ainarchaeum sp.]